MNVPTVDRLRDLAERMTRPTGPLPRPTPLGYALDVVLALVLGVGGLEFAFDKFAGEPALGGAIALVLVAVGAAVFRRRYPLAVLWIVLAATLVIPHDAPRIAFYACLLAAYSAAAHSPLRVPTLASLVVTVLVLGTLGDSGLPTVPDQYVPYLILVPIVLAANGLRTWKLRTVEGRARLSELEREQAEELRKAVEHERTRIARELHDVVTHNVSVMVIQAGAARKVMTAEPEQARAALLAVEAGGRAAMSELRHVMGLLSMAGTGSTDLAPQPGLDQLPALVSRVRDAGLPVELTVTGRPRPLPSGVELAAYRVVQEALTNTVKHAAGASAKVVVDYGPDLLRVEVADTGGQATGATGNGRGLIGLRERLAVYGGELRTGPRALGGYRVAAQLPLETQLSLETA